MHQGYSVSTGETAGAPLCPDLDTMSAAELGDLLEGATLSDVLALVVTEPGAPLPARPPRRERRAERYGHRRPLPPDHPAAVLTARGGHSAAWRTAERLTPSGAVPEPSEHAEDSPEVLRLAAAHRAAERLRDHAAHRLEAAEALDVLLLALALLETDTAANLEDRTPGPEHAGPAPPETPPQLLAVTRSTLTAAPPATAPSVPGSRCAVPMAA